MTVTLGGIAGLVAALACPLQCGPQGRPQPALADLRARGRDELLLRLRREGGEGTQGATADLDARQRYLHLGLDPQ